jgi:hypothetical protein
MTLDRGPRRLRTAAITVMAGLHVAEVGEGRLSEGVPGILDHLALGAGWTSMRSRNWSTSR